MLVNQEGSVLFNDSHKTYTVKDHSAREETRSNHYMGYFRLAARNSLYVPERNVLFNDALNTFNLRLYGVRHMVKEYLYVPIQKG